MPSPPFHVPAPGDWFPVIITDEPTTGEFTFAEVALHGSGDWDVKAGGRVATTRNPGVAIVGTFAEDDYALARSAPTAGGNLWELIPLPASLSTVEREMTGSYNLTAQDTWENVNDGTDVSVELTPGRWLLFAPVTGRVQANPITDAGWLVARLYDSTDAVVVPGTGVSVSDGLTMPGSAANILLLTATIVSRPYTVPPGETRVIKLQAAFNDPNAATTATVYGEISDFVDLGNTTHITAMKLS